MGTSKDYTASIDGVAAVQGDIPYIAGKLYIAPDSLRVWLYGRAPRGCSLEELPARWLVGGEVMDTDAACRALDIEPAELRSKAHAAARYGKDTPLRLRYEKRALPDKEIESLQMRARSKQGVKAKRAG